MMWKRKNALRRAAVETLEGRQLFAAYPAGSGVVDVTAAPYNAIPNDSLDDTAAIQAAINAFPNGDRVIWLPNGTYNISNTISWTLGAAGTGDDYKRTILEGQSRDGVILQLNNNNSLYQSTTSPRAMIFTGDGVAQKFRNSIRDLTVNTGTGNPGAIGIQYMSNNQGTLRNVSINSGDGQGVIGLDTTRTSENGPALISNVSINGFQTGIRSRFQVNSLTFENITLTNQSVYGFWNDGQQINIRGLTSTNSNTIPVIYQQVDTSASMTLLDANLTGTGAANPNSRAIWNQRALYTRNLVTSGYAKSIDHDDKGFGNPDVTAASVTEWHSHATAPQSANGTWTTALNLPVLETPAIIEDAFADWVSPEDYGAIRGDTIDDSVAIQAAIDSGKKTLLFKGGGNYVLNQTVYVRNNIQRVTGTEGRIITNDTDGGRFVVTTGNAEAVRFDRLNLDGRPIVIENNSSRTLTVANTSMGVPLSYVDSGTGDLFLEDVVGDDFEFNGGKVFARQFNVENEGTHVVNDGAELWILGFKTEDNGTKIETRNGGKTEILGGMLFTNESDDYLTPAFINDNSTLSINGVVERVYNPDPPLVTWVREISSGITTDFRAADIIARGNLWYATRPGTGVAAPASPTALTGTAASFNLINISWTDNATTETSYLIQRSTSSDFSQNIVNTTVAANTTAYSASPVDSSTTYYFRVRALNTGGAHSNWTTPLTVSTPQPPAAAKLSGTIIGTAGSYQNAGNDFTKAYDQNFGTYFDGPTANGVWTGLDLGSPQKIEYVKYAPRPSFGGRMLNGQFQVSTVADFSTFTTVYTITSTPPAGELTTAAVNAPGQYRYIRYFSPNGSSGNVAELEFWGGAPAAPTAFAATTTSNTQINVSWTDNANDETGFTLDVSTDPTFATGTTTVNLAANTTTYSATGLTAVTQYYFRIQANKTGYASSYFSPAISATTYPTPPAAPTALVLRGNGMFNIEVAWQDNSNNETGWDIQTSTNGGTTWTSVTQNPSNFDYEPGGIEYNITGLPSNTPYLIRVLALNGPSASPPTNTLSTTTRAPMPTGLVGSAVSSTQIDLIWNATTNAVNYTLERSTNGYSWSTLACVEAPFTSYSDTSVLSGITYHYRVRVNNGGGNSTPSSVVQVTTP